MKNRSSESLSGPNGSNFNLRSWWSSFLPHGCFPRLHSMAWHLHQRSPSAKELFFSSHCDIPMPLPHFISAMDIHGKKTFANKVLLALSVTFQITSRSLWPMVVTSMLAIVDRHPLSASQAALLLLCPVVTHWTVFVWFLVISNRLQWTFIFLFKFSCVTSTVVWMFLLSSPASYWKLRTHQRVLHIISNTWVNIFDKIAISYSHHAMQSVRWDERVGSCNKGFIGHGNNGKVCLLRAYFGLSKVK